MGQMPYNTFMVSSDQHTVITAADDITSSRTTMSFGHMTNNEAVRVMVDSVHLALHEPWSVKANISPRAKKGTSCVQKAN